MRRKFKLGKWISDISYNHSVKISLGLAVLIALLAQTPVEYLISILLAVMAYLDYEDGRPLF
jgi:hypothetical protein